MKLCKDCDGLTIICDFCKYSRETNEYETEELLYCEFHNKGTNFKWKGITYSNNFIMKLKTMMKYILNK